MLAVMALFVLLASGVALAVVRVGDAGPNFILGTNRADTLEGRGGNEDITGLGGRDVVAGQAGRGALSGGFGDDVVDGGGDDVMGGDVFPFFSGGSGTYGNDVLDGGAGNYYIVTRLDGANPRRDIIGCGAGRDTAYADPIDTVGADCERVRGTGRSLVRAYFSPSDR